MSEVMLLGILRMPPDLWTGSAIDVFQRHETYRAAADEIERLRAAMEPFARIVLNSSGRIPTERLSLADWHGLTKALGLTPNAKIQRRAGEASTAVVVPAGEVEHLRGLIIETIKVLEAQNHSHMDEDICPGCALLTKLKGETQ